jgi:hypothetical protein
MISKNIAPHGAGKLNRWCFSEDTNPKIIT